MSRARLESSAAEGMGHLALRVRDLSIEEWGESKAVEMVGVDPTFLEIQNKIDKIAAFHEPVLIMGESGSGKEALAQAIYLLGPRRGKPLVSVNCPQYLEGNLTVSELFGHKKGSFTGASADRKGCFETADGGVIFLDEIGDLHMSAQVMLMRALANGEFQPLGSDSTRMVNVRVVAATNRPLDRLMVGNEFRHDLFFRLQYFLLAVPPLRERRGDWYLLLQHFMSKLHDRYGVRKCFSADSLKLLASYDWPGNVRELISVATTGYALCDGDTIEPRDFVAQLSARPTAQDSRDDLYQRVVVAGESFWEAVYTPFMNRDLNRAQVKAFIQRGLMATRGSYRDLLELLRLSSNEYHRFMDSLRHHQLKP